MRKNSVFIAIAIAMLIGVSTLLQSCSKLAKNLVFNLPMQTGSASLTIPVTSDTASLLSVGPATTSFNVDSFIRANTDNQLGSANISSVKLVSVTLSLSNATSANSFGNLESCTVSLTSDKNSTPYLMTIPSNPDGLSSTLTLPVDTAKDVSSYIGTQYYYNVSAKLRRPITAPLNCTVSYAYNVVVKG